jgi:hypothetical protein
MLWFLFWDLYQINAESDNSDSLSVCMFSLLYGFILNFILEEREKHNYYLIDPLKPKLV